MEYTENSATYYSQDGLLSREKALKIPKMGYYFGHILFGLIVAQFLQKQTEFGTAVALFVIIVHALIIFYQLRDPFLFILYIFSLCTIFTEDIYGGIALVAFIVLITSIGNPGRLALKDPFIRFFLLILILTNFAGYFVKNTTDMVTRVQSMVIFSGIILTFLFVQNLRFSRVQASVILKVVTFLSVIAFLAAVNQKYVLIDSPYPLLGTVRFHNLTELSRAYYGRYPSLLFDYELFAEFSLLLYIVSFSIIMDKKLIDHFKFGIYPYILLFTCLLSIFMSGTRAGFLLVLAFSGMFLVVRMNLLFSSTTLRLILILVALIPVLVVFGDSIGFDLLLHRLREIDLNRIGIESIRSGEEMNRTLVYSIGRARLASDNWFLGYGFGRGASNAEAWFGGSFAGPNEVYIMDFHSLYLCFPMIYGWIGGYSYFAIIGYLIVMLAIKYFSNRNHPVGAISLGLAFMLAFFLIDQIKINSLRYYNYHFLIWILMGFALSIVKTPIRKHESSMVH